MFIIVLNNFFNSVIVKFITKFSVLDPILIWVASISLFVGARDTRDRAHMTHVNKKTLYQRKKSRINFKINSMFNYMVNRHFFW